MDVNVSTGAAIPTNERIPLAVDHAVARSASTTAGDPWQGRLERYLLWILLAAGAVVMIGPFYWMLVTSLKLKPELLAYPPTWWPKHLTWNNWRSLNHLTAGSFKLFFRNSIFVASSVTLLTLLISSMSGYVFAKLPFPGRDRLFWVVLSLMMIPFTVSIIPSFALMVRLHWINSYWALIIPIVFNPFGIFLMRQFMFGLPGDLLDAARMDGASEFRVFFQVAIPLSQAALAALGILTYLAQWNNFLWPLVILNSANKYTIPLGLAQFRGKLGIEVGPTAAGSLLAVLPVLIIYIFAQRKFVEGISLSGLKG